MSNRRSTSISLTFFFVAVFLAVSQTTSAQAPAGPQAAATPTPTSTQQQATAAPKPATSSEKIRIPAGTRVAVVLENAISTRGAKPGDSVYFRTSFPITQNNRIVIPVGSYLRGEILESKRPGKVKGKGEFRMRLDTLIFPNGYTVDLNAIPRSAGPNTVDPEGKLTGPGGGGKDARTAVETTAAGAGIGAIADGAKGAGIGAGIGGLAGLGAILLTRGPDAELPRGSALDVVLEHELLLDSSEMPSQRTGGAPLLTPPPGI